MNLSRRHLVAAGATTLLGGAVSAPFLARADEAKFTYKYANNLPDTHPMNARAREMAAAIKQDTNGAFDLQIFPSSQLGSDTDTLSQIRSGGVEFFTLSGLILATLVPAAADQRHGLRVSELRYRLESDGRRSRRLCPRADRQDQSARRHGEDLGQRLSPDHHIDQADRARRRTIFAA